MYAYEDFVKDVFRLSGIDLACYKERQMRRRLESLVKRYNAKDFQEFYKILQTDKEAYETFLSYLTINVSEFYRNPVQWKTLEGEIVPALLKQNVGKALKVWSAACSTGDEPYSLVMMLSRFMPLNKITIDATDIDKQIIEKAKLGIYDEKSLQGLPAEFKEKYFTKVGARAYQISDDIKKRVKFRQHNLLKDKYDTNYDLILCRNVMIYFTEEAKHDIYKKFYGALKKQGVLFVGSTEQMLRADEIGFHSSHSFFYTK